jgi:diguanylate cyclase (GGDEF)-like protein
MRDGLSLFGLVGDAVREGQAILPFLALFTAAFAIMIVRILTNRLAVQAQRLRALSEAASDGMVLTRAGRIAQVNPALARLMDVGPAWFDHRLADALLDGAWPSNSTAPEERLLILPDGRHHPVEVVARAVGRSDEQVLAIRDLAPRKASQAHIERLTRTDLLTGVGNRQMLLETLGKTISVAERAGVGVALLRIDLDRFKTINNALGAPIADQILILAAHRLSATVREGDTVARIGGDEYGIVQPLAGSPADATALAERIIIEMQLPFEVDGQSITVGASVGVAVYPADGATAVDLMARCAHALNTAKRDGRGIWRYCEPGTDRFLREQQALMQDLGTALAGNQFYLVYQPFFDTATLQLVGYEALLRWEHPVHGAIPPTRFIPLAEECGLIVALGLWVLRTACLQAASWTSKLVVAVNLSPVQLLHENVAQRLRCLLCETGLEPSRLELEITEGVLMADTERSLRMMTALRELGVKLTMDDFGTGYSSLSYLRKFPFNKLKIDRSFISDLDQDGAAQSLVQAIIALSRSLGLEVTAEGVETPRQLAWLRDEGCGFVQGYLLGRPEPARQLHWDTLPAPSRPALLPPPTERGLRAASGD